MPPRGIMQLIFDLIVWIWLHFLIKRKEKKHTHYTRYCIIEEGLLEQCVGSGSIFVSIPVISISQLKRQKAHWGLKGI